MLPKGLLFFLSTIITNYNAARAHQVILEQATPQLTFELRHVHALLPDNSQSVFADVHFSSSSASSFDDWDRGLNPLQTNRIVTHRPNFLDTSSLRVGGWELDTVLAPNVSDRATLLELAKMTRNAYIESDDDDWYTLKGKWKSFPFGWEPEASGFRGHVFVSTDNSTVILTIKGTSLILGPGTGGPTGREDKLNDNLLFSCCCAHMSWHWSSVCDCYRGNNQCERNCLEDSLEKRSLFHNVGVNLYSNISALYPDSDIWIIGHSLGGAIASLLGATFGAPVVTFESPGEALAARRLHLPSPPSTQHITHFMHTADPIAMGTCNGVLSLCALFGYVMETKCHLGQLIVLDTVNELNWSVDPRTHPIKIVVEKLLGDDSDWFPSPEDGDGDGDEDDKESTSWGRKIRKHKGKPRDLPAPKPEEEDCMETECYEWEFI